MKKIILIGFLIVSAQAKAETMVQGNSVNDKEKQDVCVARAKSTVIDGFLISKKYVEIKRGSNPDATFIATNLDNPTLVVCYQRGSTGKFEPAEFIPQDKNKWVVIRPSNPIEFNTKDGTKMANQMCQKSVVEKIQRSDIKNLSTSSIFEVLRPPHIGMKVNSIPAERYDVLSEGNVILSSSSNQIDLDRIHYKCLLDPSYNVKSIETKPQH